jgi:phospholipase C
MGVSHVTVPHRLRFLLIVAVALLVAGTAARTALRARPLGPSLGSAGIHRNALLFGKFKHIVVIVQENRTIDNLFNGFPGADTVRIGNRFGQKVHLQRIPLEPAGFNLDHSHRGFVADFDGGKMDGFDHLLVSGQHTSYAYVRAGDVKNYWTLATRFTLSDEVFQMNMGPSFSAHVNLIAAQGGYPFAFDGNPGRAGRKAGPGCLGQERVGYVDMRTPYPGVQSKGPACMDMQTVFDLLDAKSIPWRYYAPANGIGLEFFSAIDYIQHLALGPDHANLVNPESQILTDIANDQLPPVSYVVPQMCTSDHPRSQSFDPIAGPHWVASITNAIGASSYWKDTLILVTWDDWGGWYDHVTPPVQNADQISFRTPLLIISAHPANAGIPDHTARNQGSIIAAIESNFGLGSLGQLDAQTDDLHNDFQFKAPVAYGPPLPAATPPPGCRNRTDDLEED